MTIRFVAELTCDHHPRCTETFTTRVLATIDSGCSPFGGPACKASLEADVYPESGWHELLNGDEWKVCCPKCWDAPDRFEPGYIAAQLRAYDWAASGRRGTRNDLLMLRQWTEALLIEPDAWEATTDGGYPRCGWGKVCGFEMQTSFGSQPMPCVWIASWAGGSWNSLDMVSEFRRRAPETAVES